MIDKYKEITAIDRGRPGIGSKSCCNQYDKDRDEQYHSTETG